MRRIVICFLVFVFFAAIPLSAAPRFTGESAIFFERGHYWIELGLSSEAGTFESSELGKRDFMITDSATGESFTPSRVCDELA